MVIPGISPLRAISRKTILDKLNLFITALGLPVLKHLVLMRIGLDDLGNLSNFATASFLSSTDIFGFLIIFPFTRKLIFGKFSSNLKEKEDKKNNFIDGEFEDIDDDNDRKI